jgi:hypothetical protein
MADIKPSDFNPMKRHVSQAGFDELITEVADPARHRPLPPDGSYATSCRQGEPSLILVPGTCSKCGCTDARACVDDDLNPCAWADEFHTLCTACVKGVP